MKWRRKLPFLLVAVIALEYTAASAQTKRRTTQRSTSARKAAPTPQPTPESRIPTAARKLKPSGAVAAFMVTEVKAGAAPGTGKRSSTTSSSDPEKFETLFDRAIVFPRDVGARIVLNSKDSGIEYIEIRGNGKGFGVNTTDGKSTLLINNYKFPKVKGGVTSGTVQIDIDAEIANAAAPEKKTGSRIKITAAFIEDLKNTRVFNVAESEDEAEPKKEIKSDSEPQSDTSTGKKKAPAQND